MKLAGYFRRSAAVPIEVRHANVTAGDQALRTGSRSVPGGT